MTLSQQYFFKLFQRVGGYFVRNGPVMSCEIFYLRQRRKYMFLLACPRSFVCLSVRVQDYSKTRAWIWMKRCVPTVDRCRDMEELINF